MNNFKNNPRRHRFRSNNDRNFKKRNGNGHKLNSDFNNNPEFKRKNPGKLRMGPLESLGHRESGTAIPSSGDSSQPSNEPFKGGHSTPFSQ